MRLDAFLYKQGLFVSRTKAQEAISLGKVLYNGKPCKTSLNVDSLEGITIVEGETFVSNGGYKLAKALNDFNFSVNGLTFADVGASNGGFTHCLLKNGAKKVYAIDVSESQLDETLKLDDRVVIKDNVNARFLTNETLGELVDGVTCDVSFISLTYVLNGINAVLKDGGVALLLIKPQFECGKEYLGNSGIVKSLNARKSAVKKVYNACLQNGLYPVNFTTAPIKEKKNVEYVIMVIKNYKNGLVAYNDLHID
ncbi:MAG: TlyA family RNA methyltransferase [Clostridia bacterium]|nr:TlyA family RNA methyltransferase [Clostridia bacterium]